MITKTYHLHCNACGQTFIADRSHARTCSDTCRLALSNIYKKIKEADSGLTKDELDTYHKLQKKIKGENVVMNTILSQGPKPTIVAESINTTPVNTAEVKPTDTTNPATPPPNTEIKK